MISAQTSLLGLLGDPVSHSLSPAMQNAAFETMGLDWCYLAMPCKTNELNYVLKGLRAINCIGLNITIPHKQDVTSLCNELTPIAKSLGAVNTLIPNKKGGWTGTNTDVEGFISPLKKINKEWQGLNAIIIGCGGSARAVLAGLTELKLEEITIIGRKENSLNNFINDSKNIFSFSKEKSILPLIKSFLIEEKLKLIDYIKNADLIVNTTPVGMVKNTNLKTIVDNNIPLGIDIWSNLKPSAVIYDLIYSPRPTSWLSWGSQQGFKCIDGLEMLLEQGAASLKLWSKSNTVPIDVMNKALKKSLKN